jgi:hypothetical protein
MALTLGVAWNWKSALTSSLGRAIVFFATNLSAGWPAAVAASASGWRIRSRQSRRATVAS